MRIGSKTLAGRAAAQRVADSPASRRAAAPPRDAYAVRAYRKDTTLAVCPRG